MDKKILLQNLADALAEHTGLTKRKAEAFVRAFFEVTEEGLTNDGIVKVKNFGTTKIVNVSDRESVNINTGERFQIEGHAKISFTPDASFRDLVNRPFAHFTTIILDDDVDLNAPNEEASSVETELAIEETPATEETLATEETSATEETPATEEPSMGIEIPIAEEESPTEDIEETAPTEDVEETTTTEDIEEEAPMEDIEETTSMEDIEETAPTEEESCKEDEAEEEDTEKEKNMTTETITHSTETTAETDGKKSSIIINNTIPEPRHNWWRTAFTILAMVVIALASYFAGYFRIFCPCSVFNTDTEDVATATADTTDKAMAAAVEKAKADSVAKAKADSTAKAKADSATHAQRAAEKTAQKLAEQQAAAEKMARKLAEQQAATEKATRRQAELEAAKNYPQIPDANYAITGVLKTRQIRAGENLYMIAKATYGDKAFARYISFYNNIEDPNLVTVGQRIKLPRLTRR